MCARFHIALYLAVVSYNINWIECGQYFHEKEMETSEFSIFPLNVVTTHSTISCAVQCLNAPDCTFEAFNNRTNVCILGSKDDNGAAPMTIDTSAGEWTVFSNEPESPGKCDALGMVDVFEGSCYEIINAPMQWASANNTCTWLNAQLVVFNSEDERDFVFQRLQASTVVDSVWIGGLYVSGDFEWVNGEPWVWDDWKDGEPSGLVGENCLTVYYPSSEAQFNDNVCDAWLPLICEHEN